ncbi:helix-turn-helix transcriptional regulator [Actinocorallia sp. A-T 12471]|uniref:helix-turn-helix domain-containing protein n=1 Tax=Actinocorallia sp. A-T 12471 TaxID=3089813 RepID=UPI0029CC336B|nr:helix-turn-helix transcriptional regulator [Actinocorallia sp. A-T 12471]MDX6740665.1 helix-turn-helix transcriptional regulator [Actinocorallia sp. A-T 12471]
MEAQTLPDALKMIMKEEGWSQARLAREMGVLTTWVSRVVKGQRDTSVGNAIALLGRVGYEVAIRRKTEGAEVKRRGFLAGMASVTLVPSANGNPYRDSEYVGLLSERVRGSLHGSGGITALQDAAKHLRRVQSIVTDSKDTRLLTAASSLAREVALVHYDARNFPLAQQAGQLSASYAQAAGDHGGRVTALCVLATVHGYQGDGRRNEHYARQALTVPEISPAQEADAWMNLGGGLGLLNEKRHASIALDRAREIVADLPDSQHASLTANVGLLLYKQGSWKAAQDALGEAVKGVSSESPWLGAYIMARRVQAALNASQPLLAAELMMPLARVAPLVSSARLDERLSEISKLSLPWKDVPEVKTMREQLRVLQT